MKVAAAVAVLALTAAGQAWAQTGAYPDQARTWSSYSRYGYDFNGQQDRPGDYRCDAYWDRGRDDCGASWRDQRPYRTYSSNHGSRYGGYGRNAYGNGYGQGGGYVYQPYHQGTQYYGAYGRPDQVYPGSGTVTAYTQPYGGDQHGYGANRDPNRSAWCQSRYRSYDARSGYYRALSGQLVFCG